MTASDLATLRLVQELLHSARQDLGSNDKAVISMARKQIGILATYCTGFCDAKGITRAEPIKPGFESMFGHDIQPDLESALDEVDQALEKALGQETRLWRAVLSAVGDAFIALGAGAAFAPTP